MAAIPYMPLYVADYLSDAAHLTTTEHGAYLLLIMTYWRQGKPLPNDDRKLARIAGLSGSQWTRMKPTILEFFRVEEITENGKAVRQLRHSRVEAELAKVRDKSLKNRKGGLARAKQVLSERSADAQPYQISDIILPLDKESNGVSDNSDAAFWASAKAYLGPSKAPLIGKWCRDHGQAETGKAITAAQIARAVDPVPYIERALRGSGQDYPDGHSGVPL